MATLAADKKRIFDDSVNALYEDYFVVAADILYEGSALTMASGADDVKPLAVADVFVGFCARRADNAAGAAGDIRAHVRKQGLIRNLAVTGATLNTAPGAAVYGTDDDTFTLTASGALQIGKVAKGSGTNLADVFFQGAGVRSV